MARLALGCRLALALLTAVGCTAGSARHPLPTLASSSQIWEITVYYTAVQSYHHGPPEAVRGCPVQRCERGHSSLGSFPSDFVHAVQDEGTGRITTGPHAGRYLNWAYGTGFWLDTVPADARGSRLLPWRSAAVDAAVAPFGTRVAVRGCGRDSASGDSIDPGMCRRLRLAHWAVTDRFSPGLGGRHHVDLYVGEENQPDFVNSSPEVIDTAGAQVVLGG
ncbi:MAG: hypothetical protein NVS3B26_16720 [Mycobacteriales bacterium]